MSEVTEESGYTLPEKLELIWGEGFMSPGGPAEVGRIPGNWTVKDAVVLDIGCGPGGADIALVVNHGAMSVKGVDVQPELIGRARHRADQSGLSDRIDYQLISPGPLPFTDASFDVVFSKDALLHVADKASIYREAYRVLRPGGFLLVSDWLRGLGQGVEALVHEFVVAAGHEFHMVTLPRIKEIARTAGFIAIETEDRGVWYTSEARVELARLTGALSERFVAEFGLDTLAEETAFWQVLVRALEARAMSPGHIRATKPG